MVITTLQSGLLTLFLTPLILCVLILYISGCIYSYIYIYIYIIYRYIGSAKYLFFGKYFKIKLLNIFSNFIFYLKVQSFRLIMENNFIQIAASAGHAVAYTICVIFKHIIDCVQLSFKASIVSALSP